MTHSNKKPARLLTQYASQINGDISSTKVLDLAGGYGRNGLHLARIGYEVIFADKNREALEYVAKVLEEESLKGATWLVDLEGKEPTGIGESEYGAILVFNYLHRPLLGSLKNGVAPGGVIIYETFTVDQPKYGRPHNPDFLLKKEELKNWMADWHCVHYFEGDFSVAEEVPLEVLLEVRQQEIKETGKLKSIAQIVSIRE